MNYNIFGEPLITCSIKPLTGFFRNGCCDTNEQDIGLHTVCVIVNHEFLLFSKSVGNDLTTPLPQYGFEGLKNGDKWCLCALRWKEAMNAGKAPPLNLDSTNKKTLEYIDLDKLKKYKI